MLPFTNLFIEKYLLQLAPSASDISDPTSACWLARALAEATADKFRMEKYDDTWRADGYELVGPFKKS